MKIFYICHSLNLETGIGRLVHDIIKSAQEEIPSLEIQTATSEDLFCLKNKFRFLLNFKKILKEAKKSDLIHVFDAYPYGFLAVIIGKLIKRPVLLTAVGTGSVKGLKQLPKSFLMKYAFEKSFKVVAISHYVKNEVVSVLPSLNVEVINPGVVFFDDDLLENSVPSVILNKKYILSVGSLKKRKGYDVSIRIFRNLLEKQPDLYYVIVTKTDDNNAYYREIKRIIDEYGISQRVLFLDNLTNKMLRSIYQHAELFILLSRNDNQDIEGFGLVFLEAAFSGVPVIGCCRTGAEDAINDGKNGYLVDIDNEKDIGEKAQKILSDKALRSQMSHESILFAEEMNYKNIIPKYVKIYSQF